MKTPVGIVGAIVLFGLSVTHVFAGQCVSLKGLGKVSLERFQCIEITKLEAVEQVCYDEKSSFLVVQRFGIYLGYCGVTKNYFEEILKAPKKSDYVDTHILPDIFDCTLFLPPSYIGQCKN